MHKRILKVFLALLVVMPAVAQSQSEQALIETKLREAEARLQAAAEEVARLSDGMHSRVIINTEARERALHSKGPRLGVALASRRVDGEQDGKGVEILSVSPGSAAAEGGVEARDRIIAVGDLSLSDKGASDASIAIGKRLEGKQIGDTLTLTILRDNKPRDLTLTLNEQSFAASENSFRFAFRNAYPAGEGALMERHVIEEMREGGPSFELFASGDNQRFHFLDLGSAWGSMELVEMSPALGSYFGSEEGLLIVSAPIDESLGFLDGDVIREIGGRVPNDVGHAMRILRSYTAGETLKVKILRKKRERTLEVTVPERRKRGSLESLRGLQWFDDGGVIDLLDDDAQEVIVIEQGRTAL